MSASTDLGAKIDAVSKQALGLIETLQADRDQWKARAEDAETELRTIRAHAIAARLMKERGHCHCDLDRWQPTLLTGHSHVCDVHKDTLAELAKVKL